MSKIPQSQNHSGLLKKAVHCAKIAIGTIFMLCAPKKRRRVENLATIPWHDKQPLDAIERLIRVSVLWWKSRDASGAQLAELHQQFWQTQSSDDYYAGTHTRFEQVFMPHFDHFLDRLAAEAASNKLNCLIEIGCGEGQLLRHLQDRVPANRYIGLDLSEDQIARNISSNSPDGPEYYAGDAIDWISKNAPTHSVYVSGLGVLEYFTQVQLTTLLQSIAHKHAPACALFIEPVDHAADFNTFDSSYAAGEEHSFTHNYPKRLQQSGWEVLSTEEVNLSSYRWLVILASCTPKK